MKLDWKGKNCIGLVEAIEAAGITLYATPEGEVCSDPQVAQDIIDAYPLSAEQSRRKAEASAIAKGMRDTAIAHVSPGEMAAWPIKRAEAMAYAASGSPADAPLLAAECAARGITLDAMMVKVSTNAAMFAGLEAAISGREGALRDQIDAAQDWAALNAIDITADWPAV